MVLMIITVLGLWRGVILKGEIWLTDLKGFSIYYSHEVLQVLKGLWKGKRIKGKGLYASMDPLRLSWSVDLPG